MSQKRKWRQDITPPSPVTFIMTQVFCSLMLAGLHMSACKYCIKLKRANVISYVHRLTMLLWLISGQDHYKNLNNIIFNKTNNLLYCINAFIIWCVDWVQEDLQFGLNMDWGRNFENCCPKCKIQQCVQSSSWVTFFGQILIYTVLFSQAICVFPLFPSFFFPSYSDPTTFVCALACICEATLFVWLFRRTECAFFQLTVDIFSITDGGAIF